MKYLVLALAGSAALGSPAFAQATQPAPAAAAAPAAGAPEVKVGASVSDTTGAPVGTIESVSGGNAVLSTGTAKAAIPVASFAKGPNGLVVGITKADLEAKVAQATTPTNIAAGMAILGPNGAPVGKVDAVAGDMVTVATANTKAQLPKTAFAQGPNGLVIGMTAEQLDAAAKAAAPKSGGTGK
jgi:Ribonuclease G/E